MPTKSSSSNAAAAPTVASSTSFAAGSSTSQSEIAAAAMDAGSGVAGPLLQSSRGLDERGHRQLERMVSQSVSQPVPPGEEKTQERRN